MNIEIKQSLNQNTVIVVNQSNEEFLLIGKGIGFNKKKGDCVDVSDSTKMYSLNYTDQERKVFELVGDIPSELILIVEEIVEGAEKMLGEKLDHTLIFVLASHIHYALRREENIDKVVLPFDYGLEIIFPKEYETAKWAVHELRDKYQIALTDAEIVFLTFHFVNVVQDSEIQSSAVDIANIISDIIDILEKTSSVSVDKSSLHFSRFIIHIRYFLVRHSKGEASTNAEFEHMFEYIAEKFEPAARIAHEIIKMLEEKYQLKYIDEEALYLLLHIQRLIDENH